MCESAKEILDTFIVSYEGTTQIKESKIDKLVTEYELFKMLENETIADIFLRFINIINKLKGLGKTYTKSENMRKILRSLLSKWRLKVTTIKESKNLNMVNMDELMGSLLTHEVELNEDDKWAETKELRRKTIALKAANSSDDESDEDENLSISEKEMSLIIKNFKKFLKRKGRKFFNKGQTSKDNKGKYIPKDKPSFSNRKDIVCYECRKPGHFKIECPKGQDKKKAYITEISWDSDEEQEEDQSEEETTNLALMVHERENELEVNFDFFSSNSNSIDDIDTNDIDEDDIEIGFKALYEASQKLEASNSTLEKEVISLHNKVDSLHDYIPKLEEEKENLKSALLTFTKGQKSLDTLFGTP
ncbi:uncharacterized protein LOC122663095 [Telopea speciosissima]|uniref:uncharacterized protein LOC122663095 n=1 Tax=Telopea speciosissima TaxID=54955 RepID=UPI001CC6329F|nr:uncharacterized protein LOC122663095 [Telopea speciosissima]